MEIFTKRAQEICSELQDYYMTFLGVMNLYETAYKALLDISKSIVTFRVYILLPHLLTSFTNLNPIQIELFFASLVSLLVVAVVARPHAFHSS